MRGLGSGRQKLNCFVMASHQSCLFTPGTCSIQRHGSIRSLHVHSYSTTKPECLAQQMHFLEMFQEDQVYSMIHQLPNISIALQMHSNIQVIRHLLSTHGYLLSIQTKSQRQSSQRPQHISIRAVYCLLPFRKRNSQFTELCIPKAL